MPSPRHRLEFQEEDGREGAHILLWAPLEKGSCHDEGRRDESLGLGEAASFLPRLWEIRPSYRVSPDEQGVTWKYPGAAVRSCPPLGPMPSCSVLPVHLDKGIRLSSCFRHRKIAIFEIICFCPCRGSHQCWFLFFFHLPDYTGLAPEDLAESYNSVIV